MFGYNAWKFKKILIIDAEIVVASQIKNELFKAGFTNIKIAYDIDTGLNIIKNIKPDLLLIDMCALDGKGKNAFYNKTRNCKTIFISEYPDLIKITNIIMKNPNGLIIKPINADELKDKVNLKLSGRDKWEKIYQNL